MSASSGFNYDRRLACCFSAQWVYKLISLFLGQRESTNLQYRGLERPSRRVPAWVRVGSLWLTLQGTCVVGLQKGGQEQTLLQVSKWGLDGLRGPCWEPSRWKGGEARLFFKQYLLRSQLSF